MKLLRVEGVNLAHSIEDTEDLSTRRGGSLLLLQAIEDIAKEHAETLTPISTGASAGLFEVQGDSADILQSVQALLAKPPYCYATFVVDVQEGKKDFQHAEAAVLAANRWQQMSSLSFATTGLTPSALGVCGVDEIRPATTSAKVKGNSTNISASVGARREHGLDAKRKFYTQQLGAHYQTLEFTNDFSEIASGPIPADVSPNLAGKMAVFYADGNKFGDIARGCATPAELTAWDSYIKRQRKQLLSALLDAASANNATYWQTPQNELRLETLLWGGDELMFVVPAWCGLELANLFFQHTANMRYPDNPAGQQLTHACGIVFCHQQAPISRIANLAKALAEQGKNANKKTNRQTNSLNWLVLESFDHTGAGLDDYLKRRFGCSANHQPTLNWPALALNADSLQALTHNLPTLKNQLPHSAMVQITRAMAQGQAFKSDGTLEPLVQRALGQVSEAGGEPFKTLWPRLHPLATTWQDAAQPNDLGAWVKLAELWDYCVPSQTAQGGAL